MKKFLTKNLTKIRQLLRKGQDYIRKKNKISFYLQHSGQKCEKLNELYLKNNIAYYGFDLFFVKIICCIKCSYDSVFFLSQTGYKKWKIYHQQKYTIT